MSLRRTRSPSKTFRRPDFHETLSEAIVRQRTQMTSTGVLDLSGKIRYESLKDVGSQKRVTKLILNESPLTSFHTLPPQPAMKALIADGAAVETLAGLGNQPRLGELSLIGTPVAQHPSFRLSALVCVGPRLSILNKKPIRKVERQMAACFPPVAKYLVSCGWMVQFPPPSRQDFEYLADEFDINASEEDFAMPPLPLNLVGMTTLMDKDVEPGKTFAQRMAALLEPLGFGIRRGPEMNGDILKAVRRICDTVAMIEGSEEPEEDDD